MTFMDKDEKVQMTWAPELVVPGCCSSQSKCCSASAAAEAEPSQNNNSSTPHFLRKADERRAG